MRTCTIEQARLIESNSEIDEFRARIGATVDHEACVAALLPVLEKLSDEASDGDVIMHDTYSQNIQESKNLMDSAVAGQRVPSSGIDNSLPTQLRSYTVSLEQLYVNSQIIDEFMVQIGASADRNTVCAALRSLLVNLSTKPSSTLTSAPDADEAIEQQRQNSIEDDTRPESSEFATIQVCEGVRLQLPLPPILRPLPADSEGIRALPLHVTLYIFEFIQKAFPGDENAVFCRASADREFHLQYRTLQIEARNFATYVQYKTSGSATLLLRQVRRVNLYNPCRFWKEALPHITRQVLPLLLDISFCGRGKMDMLDLDKASQFILERITAISLYQVSASISLLPNVKELQVSTQDNLLALLPNCQLKSLSLAGTAASSWIETLAACPSQLTSLSVKPQTFLVQVASQTQLTNINLKQLHLHDMDFTTIPAIPSLEALSVSFTFTIDLDNLRSLSRLRKLSLLHRGAQTAFLNLNGLTANTSIISLEVKSIQFRGIQMLYPEIWTLNHRGQLLELKFGGFQDLYEDYPELKSLEKLGFDAPACALRFLEFRNITLNKDEV